MSDFSTNFIALRERLLHAWQGDFHCECNQTMCARPTALHAWFDHSADVSVLGMMKTGKKTHSHEHRILLAVPTLDQTALDEAWDYACALQSQLVDPSEGHGFTMISLILACESVPRDLQKALLPLQHEERYTGARYGWSSVRICAVDLQTRKCYCNRMGKALGDLVKAGMKG